MKKPTSRSTAAKSSPKPPISPITPPPEPPSFAAAYARFLPAAEQLPPERVQSCRLDVNLIFVNVQTGLGAVLPEQARLRDELPKVPVDKFPELGDIAGALLYAAAQVAASATPMKRELLDQKMERLHALREPMLLIAEAFALLGILPKHRVDQIRAGTGPFDAAQDGVALADLFTEFAAVVKDKHPFTQAHFTEVAELGHAVLRSVTPEGARITISPELVKATAARDRLFALLSERHKDLRRAGFYLFGEQVNEKVPLLGARKGRSRSDAATTDPATSTPELEPAATLS